MGRVTCRKPGFELSEFRWGQTLLDRSGGFLATESLDPRDPLRRRAIVILAVMHGAGVGWG
jgi:hypothetical protein